MAYYQWGFLAANCCDYENQLGTNSVHLLHEQVEYSGFFRASFQRYFSLDIVISLLQDFVCCFYLCFVRAQRPCNLEYIIKGLRFFLTPRGPCKSK